MGTGLAAGGGSGGLKRSPPEGGGSGGRRRLGEVLVTGGVLTEAQLDEALRAQKEDAGGRRRRLGEVITALGLADEVTIARALSDQLGLPFVDLGSLPIADETLAVLPRGTWRCRSPSPTTCSPSPWPTRPTCSRWTTSAWRPS